MSAEPVDPSVAPSLVDDVALRLQRQVGLVPARGLGVVRRAVFFALLTWLPLVAWAVYTGRILPGGVDEPLVMHFGVHVRFLLAVPALILGEAMAHRVSTTLIPVLPDFRGGPARAEGGLRPRRRKRRPPARPDPALGGDRRGRGRLDDPAARRRRIGGGARGEVGVERGRRRARVRRLVVPVREPPHLQRPADRVALAPGPGLRAAEAHRPARSLDRADPSRRGRRPGIPEGHAEGLQPAGLRHLGGGGLAPRPRRAVPRRQPSVAEGGARRLRGAGRRHLHSAPAGAGPSSRRRQASRPAGVRRPRRRARAPGAPSAGSWARHRPTTRCCRLRRSGRWPTRWPSTMRCAG